MRTHVAARFTILSLLAGVALAIAPAAWGQGIGEMVFSFERADDQTGSGGKPFYAEATLRLDVGGLAGITLAIDMADPLALVTNDGAEWFIEWEFDTFDDMKNELDGLWTITFDRLVGTDTITQVEIILDSLSDQSIYPSPPVSSPIPGAKAAPDLVFSWTDPTGATTPDVLIVSSDNVTIPDADQDENSLEGPITLGETTWAPAGGLLAGINDFEVAYFLADASLVTAFDVTQGSFTWLPAEINPEGYPDDKPLVAYGSSTEVEFDVPLIEDFEAYAVGDGTQKMISDGGELVTLFQINDTGPTPIASVSEDLASGTRILPIVGGTQGWGLQSSTGMTDEGGFVLIGDIPALDDTATAGPFSDFFGTDPNARTPRNLFGTTVQVDLRQVAVGVVTQFRLVMVDDEENETATREVALTNAHAAYSFPQQDFNVQFTATPTDFTRITSLAIELYTTPGMVTTPLELSVEDIRIDFLPEPGAAPLGVAAVMALGWLARRRSATRTLHER